MDATFALVRVEHSVEDILHEISAFLVLSQKRAGGQILQKL